MIHCLESILSESLCLSFSLALTLIIIIIIIIIIESRKKVLEIMAIYGTDYGDGFTGAYLSSNSPSGMH